MQMVLNELSAQFPAESVVSGRKMMEEFLNTYMQVRKLIANDTIFLNQDYQSFLLAPEYRIEQWRNDGAVDMELKRRFRSMLNHSSIYHSESFRESREKTFEAEFQHGDQYSVGCQLAYEREDVAVSFLSDDKWRTPQIDGVYRWMDDEGNVGELHVQVSNVSCEENISEFESVYRQQLDKDNRENFKSGNDIVDRRRALFPNLVFCEVALRQLQRDIGAAEVSQVYKKLMELQQFAENSDGIFQKEKLNKATPESTETLKRYQEEHTFQLPDGTTRIFSWHIRFTGTIAGRIFFEPELKSGIIYIGHIGKKLPTVWYH